MEPWSWSTKAEAGFECCPFETSPCVWPLNAPATWMAVVLCLAHQSGSIVERACIRSDLREERRALMQGWADYVAKTA